VYDWGGVAFPPPHFCPAFRRSCLRCNTRKQGKTIMRFSFGKLGAAAALTLVLGVSACSNPYDPGQRAVGGGLLGAGAGAGVAGLTGGNMGTGALIGGALGAVGGAVTTPSAPDYGRNGGYPPRGGHRRGYGY
jgi:hypothetical protein